MGGHARTPLTCDSWTVKRISVGLVFANFEHLDEVEETQECEYKMYRGRDLKKSPQTRFSHAPTAEMFYIAWHCLSKMIGFHV